jgi:hypothetical protein
LQDVSLGPSNGLMPFLANARSTFSSDLQQLQTALEKGSAAATAISSFLEGHHRYLLFASNNAEMRAGSGMLLSAGELDTGPAGLSLGPMRAVTDIPIPPGVPLAGDLAARWGWLAPNQEWRNLMLSPRFDVNAPLAAQMWAAAGNPPVDGVVSMDAVTLQALLQATGPVTVSGRPIDAGSVLNELLNQQYFRYSAVQESQRHEELGQLAGALFSALGHGGWSRSELVEGLAQAARGRHILLWSPVPVEERGWHAAGVDGSLAANSLLVSVLNRGGNKLDYFLHVGSSVSFRPVPQGTEVTVELRLANQVPAGEPQDVEGPDYGSGVGAGVYLGIVSINMPAAANGGYFEGVQHLAVAGQDGPTQVMGFQLSLSRGERRTVTAHFFLPTRGGALRVEPSARVPGIDWSRGSSSWTDGSSHTVEWSFPA